MGARVETSIRSLHSLDEMRRLLEVAGEVWGIAPGGLVGPDFLMALAHGQGYVVGGFDPTDRMIAISFGFLARHRGDDVLHSHITGVVADHQNTGVGAAVKQHQRRWAIEMGLAAITWTFDPLVRRNAWFNLQRLGAVAGEYHPNFYGPLGDAINGDDDSDRLLARWDVSGPRAVEAERAGLPEPSTVGAVVVPTPDDIVALRRTDPAAARAWRRDLREVLLRHLPHHEATGVTASGSYVLTPRNTV